MNRDSYCYVGYKSVLTHKTRLFTVHELEAMDMDEKVEHYSSIYRFTETITSYDSLAGIGPEQKFYADYLTIDIDREDLDRAKHDADRLGAFLENHEIAYEYWFSGAKGYHILIPTVQFEFEPTNNPDILKKMAMSISKASGVEIDTAIYNISRMFRMPGSINFKTGKHKKSMLGEYPEPDDYMVNDMLCKLYQAVLGAEKKKGTPVSVNHSEGTGAVFRQAEKGRRNAQCFVTAKMLRERKFKIDEAEILLGIWNDKWCNPPLDSAEIKRTLISAYQGSVQTIIKDPDLTTYTLDINNVVGELKKEYEHIDKHAIKTGYDFIDDYTMGLVPGELIFWLAVNGNLKTCILSNLMANVSKNTGKYTIIFSMDMSGKALAMRHIQAAEKMTYKAVRGGLMEGTQFYNFKKDYSKVVIVDKKYITVEDAQRYCDWFRDNRGEIGFIGFDYLGAFAGCDNDNKVTGDTVHKLSALAGEIGYCPVICLAQARRNFEGHGGNVEIDKSAGKDSSAIEHKSDYIIGSWWNELRDPNTELMVRKYWGRFLKNRKFDSEKYPDNAYFSLDFQKQYMFLRDIIYEPQHPQFLQKKEYG